MVLLVTADFHSDYQHGFRSSRSNANLLTFIARRFYLSIDKNVEGHYIDNVILFRTRYICRTQPSIPVKAGRLDKIEFTDHLEK